MHIEYWKDMLEEAGLKEADIPTKWGDYWNFWCDKAQTASRQKTGKRTFGIGQPMGVDSSDSFFSFLTFMDAYNVSLVSDSGKLLVDDPKVKAGLVGALTDYTNIYARGCTPPSSTSWKDPDNNVAFHNRITRRFRSPPSGSMTRTTSRSSPKIAQPARKTITTTSAPRAFPASLMAAR